VLNDCDGNSRSWHRASYHHGQCQRLRGAPRPLSGHRLSQLIWVCIHAACGHPMLLTSNNFRSIIFL